MSVPGGSGIRPRDARIDAFKGLLVVAMVYCHVLQFFGDASLFAAENTLTLWINMTAFSGFAFAFGWSVSVAYLDKPYLKAAPRVAASCARSYGAFVVSGVAFRLLYEHKPFARNTARAVFLLRDIPGWSEFLAAFLVYGLAVLALFVPLKRMRESPKAAAAAACACLAVCFAPIKSFNIPYINLLVGGGNSTLFPAVQYAPYFIAGLVFPGLEKAKRTRVLLAAAAAASVVGGVLWLLTGEPGRFPPDVGWILTPAAVIASLALLAAVMAKLMQPCRFAALNPARAISSLGRNSLYHLIVTNIVLFTLGGQKIAPWLNTKAWFLWSEPIQSPLGALCWTIVLLAGSAFAAGLARPSRRLP
ncbi:MAG: heparan-alpha-glucosaminide N-acetyltransferase domain-containing protein [Oscillospiraceae bacterium]|jgi:fucose 4-O-acetylase-like acetyltransferase|nr:heparan-alpha-glucosaminide N-acetyltransferase domain-containing protein [Oscillospiraceae bacterium]